MTLLTLTRPGFDARAPQDSIAIVFRVNGGYDVVKKVTFSSYELSALMEIFRAVGLKSEEGGQEPHLADLIGKSLAVEVVLQGTFPKVTQVSPIEGFDDSVEPFGNILASKSSTVTFYPTARISGVRFYNY